MDRVYRFVLVAVSSLVFVLILAIIWEIYAKSRLSIHTFGLKFLTGKEWDPVQQIYSLRAFALGTLYTSFWALLIAVPISIGSAVFLSEMAPRWIRKPLTFLIELLAAIPSVVYGLWGIFVMVPWLVDHVETPISNNQHLGTFFLFNAAPNGNDFLAASALLSIMVIPIITGVARDILRAVPQSMREASYALGATRWETIKSVVLPHARAGIFGAVILGLGRALGETMAVTMVIGNNPDFNWALFSPGYTMSSVIANEFTEAPLELYRSALIEIALALLVIALIVNSLARVLVRLTARRMGTV
jgi:phosphate transport system permease protein